MHKTRITPTHIAGQSLIEILFALALVVMAVSSVGYMFLNTQTNARAVSEHTQGLGLAHEGLAATQAIAQQDFAALQSGEHGVALGAAGWELLGDSDSNGNFTRTVTLRKLNKAVVEVESAVVWPLYGGREGSVTAAGAVSAWRQNTGEAAALSIDVSGLFYGSDGTVLDGVTLDVAAPVAATALTLSWSADALLASSSLAGVEVFSASGTEPVASGETITFDAIDLTEGTVAFGPFTFTKNMRAEPLLAALELSDGSVRYIRIVQ